MQWQRPVEVGPGLGFQVALDAQGRCWWRLVILSSLHTIYSDEHLLTTGAIDAFVGDCPLVNTFAVYLTYPEGSSAILARVGHGGVYFCSPIEEIETDQA